MKRRILTYPESKKILAPFYSKLSTAILEGFSDYNLVVNTSSDKIGYTEYEPRTKACLIHDHIKKRIQETFFDVDGIKTGKWNDIFALKINDDLFIRFNKCDKYYKSSPDSNKQSKAFRKQMLIEGFPDEPTFLYAGYIPDASWTKIDGIYLSCWDGTNLIWVENLIQKTGSIQTSLPLKEEQELTQKRVRVKKRPDKKTGTSDK